jgi:DNA-binding transcriptional MerR regulator
MKAQGKTVKTTSAASVKKGAGAKEKKTANKDLVTIAELSKKLGISIRQLRNYQQQGIIQPETTSKGKESLYSWQACLGKLYVYFRDKVTSRKSSDSAEIAAEKLRRETARRKLDEMKALVMEGELHHINDLKHILGGMFTRLHTGLESLPLGIAPLITNEPDAMVIAEKIKDQLSRILYEILNFDYNVFRKADKTGYIAALEQRDEEEKEIYNDSRKGEKIP